MTFITNPALLPKVRSRSLLDTVRDMPCTLRIAGMVPGGACSHQTTVVPCHLDGTIGKGMGTKVSDLFVAAGCFACHSLLDGRDPKGRTFIMDNYPTAFMERLLKGLCETQSRWLDMGLIEVKGGEIVK
jgi:Protein of unknown function (DUF1364)